MPWSIFNVKNLSNTVFKEQTPYPADALHVVATPGYNLTTVGANGVDFALKS